MVKVREDMTGWVMSEHGVPDSRLTVLYQVEDYVSPHGKHSPQWMCECSCEQHTLFITRGAAIKNGQVKSCGCFQKEIHFSVNKKYNKYDLSGEYGIGWTSNTNKEFYFDLEDYDKIKDYCWLEYVSHNGYHSIKTRDYKNNGNFISMHYLFGYKWYDHIDKNPFNNRKQNLRPATAQENARNRSISKRNKSGVTGVYKRGNRWIAAITNNYKTTELGGYINKDDAIIARLQAEAKCFGEFAPQRHLFEQYKINVDGGDSND